MKAIYTILAGPFVVGAAVTLGLGFAWEPASGARVCDALPILEQSGCRRAAEVASARIAGAVRTGAGLLAAIMLGVAAALAGVSMLAPKS